MDNVQFDGGNGISSVGIDLTFSGSSDTTVTNCLFERLDFGIRAIETVATITDSTFEDIRNTAVFMRESTNKQAAMEVVNLDILDDPTATGSNRFSGSQNTVFIDNRASELLSAQNNDFGLASEEEILARVNGNVEVCPYVFEGQQVDCASSSEGEGEGEGEGELPVLAETLMENYASADGDGNGRLSFAEAQTEVPSLSQSQFDTMDTDNDNQLSTSDIFLMGLALLTLVSIRGYARRS